MSRNVAVAVAPVATPNRSVLTLSLLALGALALVLQYGFATRMALLLLLGAALGVTLYHAAFGFTGGWRQLIVERRSAAVRAQLLLLALTSIAFVPLLAGVLPGVKAMGAVAPVGVSVLVGAFLFGVGMQLGGGCGSGTLFTVGGGHVRMLITLAFFIVGATVGSAHLSWWTALPSFGEISLVRVFGWGPALALQLLVLGALYLMVRTLEAGRHGSVPPFASEDDARVPFRHRLLFGPWPLDWGVLGITALGLATLLLAGHPWSITFAFGLWGTKVFQAVGGDVSGWAYWASGYPAQALSRSVFADTISVMDFGIILGAMLAAALAGRFAPKARLRGKSIAAAVLGGLLLGYGARLAFGCNIGALLAGVGSGSVHGWLWLVAGFIGNMAGVRARRMFALDALRKEA